MLSRLSLNSWRITTRKQASALRQFPIWQRAGERANERAAHAEAISYFTKGLELLKAAPDTSECLQRKLSLYTLLGRTLKDVRGYGDPEVEQAYTRARELCRQIGEAPQLFSTLLGLSIYFVVRAELQTARELGQQLLDIAQRVEDSVLLVEAHYALGVTCFWMGEFDPARKHLEQGIEQYDLHRHHSHIMLFGQDEGVVCLCRAALARWYLGYPDQALTGAWRRSHWPSSCRTLPALHMFFTGLPSSVISAGICRKPRSGPMHP